MNVDLNPATCYKIRRMKRPKVNVEKKTELVGAKVAPSIKTAIEEIAEAEDRTLSYTAGALIVRGIEAYRRDRSLRETEE